MKIVSRAPARVDPAGGGTDAPPYCIDYGGAVVNISIARFSYATFERLPKECGANIYSRDLGVGTHAPSVAELKPDGRTDFLQAFVRRLIPQEEGFLLVTQSDIPERTGLGGSGALGVAVTSALTRASGKEMSKSDIALLGNDIERNDLGHSGGNQDSFGAAIGGIKLITYQKGGGCFCERLEVPARTLYQLERDTLLIYTGDVHLSGSIHSDIKRSYALENSPTIRAMDQLKSAAQNMRRALEVGNIEGYIENLNLSRVSHYQLHPSCDSDTLRHFFKELDPYILGGKTCGAGGGGFMLVYMKSDRRKECIQAAEKLGGMVWNFNIDLEGVVAWEEADSSEEERRGVLERLRG